MPNKQDQSIVDGKIFAVLGYLFILCIIPLIFKKDNPFVLLHSRQGLVLFLCEVAVFLLSIVFPWVLKPGLFVFFAASFIGIIAALQGKELSLPLVTEFAEKITL